MNFQGHFGEKVVEIPVPEDLKDNMEKYRSEMIERVVEFDDALTEKYLNGEEITNEEFKKAARQGVVTNQLFPVFAGSALKNVGVQLVLDAVIDYLPSPLEVPPMLGTDPKDPEKKIETVADDNAPFAALAFKIATDPFVGKLCFVRVYQGVLKAGSYVYNSSSGTKRADRTFGADAREPSRGDFRYLFRRYRGGDRP